MARSFTANYDTEVEMSEKVNTSVQSKKRKSSTPAEQPNLNEEVNILLGLMQEDVRKLQEKGLEVAIKPFGKALVVVIKHETPIILCSTCELPIIEGSKCPSCAS